MTFYSLARANPDFLPDGFRFRAPPSAVVRAGVRGSRWLALAGLFGADQLGARSDVVLSYWGYPMGAFAVGLAALARRPAVVMLLGAEAADLPTIDYGHLGRPASRGRLLWACAHARALIAVSRYQLERLEAHGFRRDDARVIPIGAEAARFPFVAKRPGTPVRLIHVANLTAVKDQGTLLRAFARLRGMGVLAKLRVVGEDNLGGAIQRLADQLGVRSDVEFTGAVPYAEMPSHYRWADIAVSTSLSEGQNLGLTEAAMSGVLVVGTPVGHLYDLGEAAAVVVKAGDPEDVAARIAAIIGDSAGWQRRVEAARAWASAHDMTWTTDRIGEILEGLA